MGSVFWVCILIAMAFQFVFANTLLDFYDWVPEGQTSFVMMAGSAMEITEFDAWMLRDWWRKLKAVRGW